jgi:hypothetical protein
MTASSSAPRLWMPTQASPAVLLPLRRRLFKSWHPRCRETLKTAGFLETFASGCHLTTEW